MIRRWLAVLALIGVAVGPSLRAWCEIECAGDDTSPAAAVRCHEHAPPSSTAIATADNCGHHELLAAVAESRRALLTGDLSGRAEAGSASAQLTPAGFAAITAFADIGPPITLRSLALRL